MLTQVHIIIELVSTLIYLISMTTDVEMGSKRKKRGDDYFGIEFYTHAISKCCAARQVDDADYMDFMQNKGEFCRYSY